MSYDSATRLGYADLERMADFLLLHMDTQTRAALMSELPIAYAKLFPRAQEETILAHVREGIRAARLLAQAHAHLDRAARNPDDYADYGDDRAPDGYDLP